MTKKKKNNPRSQSSMTSFPDSETIREKAEQKAGAIALPDLDNMTHEEIRQMVHEMKVKQIEADLQIEHLRSGEDDDDQASLFSIVTENMLDMVALTDMEGNFTFAGKSHEVLGYEPGFLIGKNVMDFVHPEDLPRILEEFAEFVASGHPRKVEYRNRCRDGNYLWLETIGNFITDENGSPQKIVFNSRNITERKQAEETFRESENKLYLLAEEAPVSIMYFDKNGIVKFVNKWHIDVFTKGMLGRDFFIDKKITDLPGIQSAGIGVELEKILKGETVLLEQVHIPKFAIGHEGYQCIRGVPLFYNGESSGGVLIREDITERKQAEEALRKSEELLTASERLSKTGGWEWNVETQTMYWTEENYRIHDFTPGALEPGDAEHINRSVECYEPEDRPIILAAFQRCVEEGQSYDLEFPFTTAKGRRLWIRTIAQPVSENGKVIRVIGNIMDITERKRAEEENRIFRTISDNAVHGKAIANLKGNLLYVNRFFAELHGYKPEQLIGKHFSLLHSREQAEAADRIIASMIREGRFEPTTVWHHHQDGTEFPMLMSGVLIRDQTGEPQYIAASAVDMTQFYRTQQDYQTLFHEMLNGFALHEIICDAAGAPVDYRFLSVNPSFERMTGLTAENIVGRTVLEVLPSTELHWIKTYGKVALTGDPVFFENYHTAIKKHFEVTAFSPAPKHFACIFQDITERKQAEEEREQLQEQLFHSQKMQVIGQLAGGVAHEFNNMLNVILGYTEMIMTETHPSDPNYPSLMEIQNAAQRSADIARKLLGFARKQTISPRKIDLNETIEYFLPMLQGSAGDSITIVWKPGKGAMTVKMDPMQVDQILTNLVLNARDAISGIGTVTLETDTVNLHDTFFRDHDSPVTGEFFMLGISDNGHGMEKETLDRIFEPFFTTKNLAIRSGLGIPTVYGIVRQNNGFISIQSDPGKGSVFRIYLPIHAEPYVADSSKHTAQQCEEKRRTILVVEDETAILKLMVKMFEKSGYTVLAANSPGNALDLTEKHAGEIDLVVTDVFMPEMSGPDLIEIINVSNPDIKVLYMSGYTSDLIAEKAIEKDLHFIPKPFSLEKMASKIKELLE